MRNVMILAVAVLMLVSCGKKKEQAALVAYEAQKALLEELYEDGVLDDEAIDEAYEDATDDMLELAELSPEVALRLFEDKMVAYMTIEQKARLFAVVNLDSRAARGFDKAYSRYQAELKTQAGSPMIDIICATPKGDTLRLSEVVAKNDFVLLDFWASWCRPCRELMPKLKDLYAENKGKLEIVSVSIDKDLDAWEAMIDKLELPWLHGAVQLARPNTAPAEEYGVSFIPTLFFIGHDGIIIAREPDLDFIREKLTSEN